jgi:hypothetical protein
MKMRFEVIEEVFLKINNFCAIKYLRIISFRKDRKYFHVAKLTTYTVFKYFVSRTVKGLNLLTLQYKHVCRITNLLIIYI